MVEAYHTRRLQILPRPESTQSSDMQLRYGIGTGSRPYAEARSCCPEVVSSEIDRTRCRIPDALFHQSQRQVLRSLPARFPFRIKKVNLQDLLGGNGVSIIIQCMLGLFVRLGVWPYVF